jgi:GTP-binding protein HflX
MLTRDAESGERKRAVIATVQFPGVTDDAVFASRQELRRLLETLGYEVVGHVVQKRATLAPAAVLGEGKLTELAAFTGGSGVVPDAASQANRPKDKARRRRDALLGEGEEDTPAPAAVPPPDAGPAARRADVVAVDHEISPSQARNLELACDAEVRDRTGVIVEIFHRHAKSREARLQVEIARLTYQVPRLRLSTKTSERQQGKGAGESQLELDRRRVRDRIAALRQELAEIESSQGQRRARRAEARRVALVGYTNAGKSSLMRAMTGHEVYVADKLFATLDTTVRAIPDSHPRILVSDTVGFISQLPHDLVASFRSTLDEAREASLLLYVTDASDPTFRDQLAVTRQVLGEIQADEAPSLLLLNKVDRLGRREIAALQREFPDAVCLSAHRPEDVAALIERITTFFDGELASAEILLPYARSGLIGEIRQQARVVSETHDELGFRLTLRAEPAYLDHLRRRLEAP